VEVVVPVVDPEWKRFLIDTLLGAYLRDNVKARQLSSDGRYVPVPFDGSKRFDAQTHFMRGN